GRRHRVRQRRPRHRRAGAAASAGPGRPRANRGDRLRRHPRRSVHLSLAEHHLAGQVRAGRHGAGPAGRADPRVRRRSARDRDPVLAGRARVHRPGGHARMSPGEETGPDTGPPAGTARAPEADAPPATGADPGTGAPPATGADPEAGAVPVGMIWAQARGGVIGAGGTMPWHLPEDLAHFRRITTGRPVVMGRRTYEPFPPRIRPLPGRTTVVTTRSL